MNVEEIKKSDYEDYHFSLCKWLFPNIGSKHLICFLITLTIGLLVVLLWRYFWRVVIFLESNATTIIALITLICTVFMNYKTNKFNTVAKARIEWIKENRSQMAQFVLKIRIAQFKYDEMRLFKKGSNETENRETLGKLRRELNVVLQEIQGIENVLILSIPENEDNKQLLDCIRMAGEWIDRYTSLKKGDKWDNVTLVNLTKVSRDYYKREWERAKRGL